MYIFVLLTGKQAVCCEVRNRPLDIIQMNFVLKDVPWLRQLVADLSPQRTGFDPGPSHVSFVVDKVLWDRIFSENFCFPCLPVLSTYLSINITLTRRPSGRTRRTLNQITALSDTGNYCTEHYLHVVHV